MLPGALLARYCNQYQQSASFIRMPVMDATLSIDGAYHNPAGLVLQNGSSSLNNHINKHITITGLCFAKK